MPSDLLGAGDDLRDEAPSLLESFTLVVIERPEVIVDVSGGHAERR